MLSYDDAVKMLNGRPRKKIENNTYLERDLTCVRVLLHGHPVVLIRADGTYTLDSCGHRSATTKDRMNKYAPVRVYQRKRDWYVSGYVSGAAEGVPFESGMRVDARGRVLLLTEGVKRDACRRFRVALDTPDGVLLDLIEEHA